MSLPDNTLPSSFDCRNGILTQSDPFYDAVSCISSCTYNQQQILGITSWDGSVRICKILQGDVPKIQQVCFGRYKPCNQCCFGPKGDKFYFCDIYGAIYVFDLYKLKTTQIMSSSNNSFSSINIDQQEKHIYISTFSMASYRYKLNGKQKCTFKNMFMSKSKFRKSIQKDNVMISINSNNKINCSSITGLKSNTTEVQWTLQQMKSAQINTCLAISKSMNKIAVGKTQGLISIADILKSGRQKIQLKNQYCWYSNRHQQNGVFNFFSVNSLDFNPVYQNILVIGISDGSVILYDTNQRRTVKQIRNNFNPVTNVKFSANGKYLIYAQGDDFHRAQNYNSSWKTSIKILAL